MNLSMNPTIRYSLRIGFVVAVAIVSTLQAGGGALDAIYAALISGGGYAGIGAATPLEPSIGKKA